MAIISQTITNLGPVAKRGTVSRGDYVASREDWEDHLTQVTVGEINTWSTQANALSAEVNQIYNETLIQQVIMSGYLASTNQAKQDTQGYASAANVSYQNTVSLLDATDITGTGGYTIEAIDNLKDDQDLEEFLNFNI
jgi:hypothetical protein